MKWRIDDRARLHALHDSGILDTPDDPAFDAIVQEAAALCGTPVALVTLLDRNRQWFKARVGTDVCETPIGMAICTHALGQSEVLVIPDLAGDPRTADNPLVKDAPMVRFYAGAPLITARGQMLGTVCVLDFVPRGGLGAEQRTGLMRLAARAMEMIALPG